MTIRSDLLSAVASAGMILPCLVCLLLVFSCCSTPDDEAEKSTARMLVFVSIPPQAFIAERIGGGLVEVEVLVKPGQEPHTFEPLPRQMTDLARAKLYFKAGMPFEQRLVEKIAAGFGELKIVDSFLGAETAVLHSQAADDHEEHDPHVWLAPSVVRVMAGNTAEALSEADPGNTNVYQANLAGFLAELEEVDSRISYKLARYLGGAFYVLHPAYGHFAEEYGLRQVALEAEGKLPSPQRLVSLIEQARRDGVLTVFVQPQFDRKSAEALANAIGAEVVVLDPLARDLFANLERIAEALASSFSAQRNGIR
ncbi:MAG TPA: zinc ABC transporter substrate-binding protein [Acidobacteriota bacterium]|nr:zinc ABC transporter substrate-binding protein [Acidobacteriota bacterium]